MKYSVDKQEKYAVFTLHEENLNSKLAPELRSEFYKLHSEEIQNVIFDLSDVKYVDSSGLSAILSGRRAWEDFGSFIVTGVVSPHVKKLIEISKLDSILTIVPTVAEGVEFVFMEEIERQLNEEE